MVRVWRKLCEKCLTRSVTCLPVQRPLTPSVWLSWCRATPVPLTALNLRPSRETQKCLATRSLLAQAINIHFRYEILTIPRISLKMIPSDIGQRRYVSSFWRDVLAFWLAAFPPLSLWLSLSPRCRGRRGGWCGDASLPPSTPPGEGAGAPPSPRRRRAAVRADDWRRPGRDGQWQRRSQVSVFTPLLAAAHGRSPRPPGQSRRGPARCRSSHLAAAARRHFRHPPTAAAYKHRQRVASPSVPPRRGRGRRRAAAALVGCHRRPPRC